MAYIKLNNDALLEILRLLTQDSVPQWEVAQTFGVTQSTISHFVNRKTYPEFWEQYDSAPLAAGTTTPPAEKIQTLPPGRKTIVITSAQCNTYRHSDGLKSLLNYVDLRGATLLVAPFHYNKRQTEEGVWFDVALRPYINNGTIRLADDLVYCGHLDISPTAVKPTSGFHNYMGTDSLIIPHAKLQLDPQPTPQNMPAKHIHTTGTVTQRNYIQRKAGQKAEWHHVFGALVVEIDDDGDWYVRPLNFETRTGNFYDLDGYYTPKGATYGHRLMALNFGDIHAAKLTDEMRLDCWAGKESLLALTRPEHVFLNDVHDHDSRNHHHKNDCYTNFTKYTQGAECVRSELELTTQIFNEINHASGGRTKIHVIDSNHDRALERWLKEGDYKQDHVNAVFFLELQLMNYQVMERGLITPHTFSNACHIVDSIASKHVHFALPDEPIEYAGVRFDQHGDRGNNGARGGVVAFDKQGVKIVVGHCHSANIFNGVYTAGVCMTPEDSSYASGGSNWSVSHVGTYANGKRAMFTMKQKSDGSWRHKA